MHDEVLVPGVELLESMRSVGYSLEAAVADIVDNSITAQATQIDIVVEPVDGSYVWVLDNGTGMTPSEARDALRLAGTRVNERAEGDLGRFGLGLKTASLSQARRLSVATVKNGVTTGLQWDLDRVITSGNWTIGVLDTADLAALPGFESLVAVEAGTLVVWQELDYLLAGAAETAKHIAEKLDLLREHLGFTFQRFLSGRNAVTITVNGVAVPALDPFLESKPSTQVSPEEKIVIGGQPVTVQAYTLPHPSSFTAKERRRRDLGAQMRDSQGFYVYRNNRLISRGGWFGLHKADELSKQSRVRVEIPNSLDHLWQIDIKKSRVEPPQAFRTRLRQIIEQVTGTSRRVHRFRGRAEAQPDRVFMWQRVTERNGYRYEINPDHPLVLALKEGLPTEKLGLVERVLADISDTFPAADLYVQVAENAPRDEREIDIDGAVARLRAIRDAGGYSASAEDMTNALRRVEPFDAVSGLERLVREVWEENRIG